MLEVSKGPAQQPQLLDFPASSGVSSDRTQGLCSSLPVLAGPSIAELDLLRKAIIHCSEILRLHPEPDLTPLHLPRSTGGPGMTMPDLAAVCFLSLMRKEQVEITFSLRPQGNGTRQLFLGLAQNQARVLVRVAESSWTAGDVAGGNLALRLTLRGILGGLAERLAQSHGRTVRPWRHSRTGGPQSPAV